MGTEKKPKAYIKAELYKRGNGAGVEVDYKGDIFDLLFILGNALNDLEKLYLRNGGSPAGFEMGLKASRILAKADCIRTKEQRTMIIMDEGLEDILRKAREDSENE